MPLAIAPAPTRAHHPNEPAPDLIGLMTVAEVAALLKVSRSWVYEHTRLRGKPCSDRLPHIKLGKYVRFDPHVMDRQMAR
jgi:excisionase family DNA binding protein